MSKPKILVQLDTDATVSVFDSVVALDAGAEHLLPQACITADNVVPHVHGVIFTRGPADLHHTAIFIGGSDVPAAEAVLERIKKSFLGPLRCSVMLDASGANTTAAAAVLAAARHVPLAGATALVLAATGPVGQRAVRLLAQAGATVRVASRSVDRASKICDQIHGKLPKAALEPVATDSEAATLAALDGVNIVIAAGAAGVTLLSAAARSAASQLRVAIDLNAVPPLGIEGVEVMDKAVDRDGVTCYGALGVGGTKMKIHKAALARLFESNDAVLDAEGIFALGQKL